MHSHFLTYFGPFSSGIEKKIIAHYEFPKMGERGGLSMRFSDRQNCDSDE